jgi:hypothetical protein
MTGRTGDATAAKVIESPAVATWPSTIAAGSVTSASSGDLMMWTHRAVIDEPATQPTIAMAPDGAPVRRRRCAAHDPAPVRHVGLPPGPQDGERSASSCQAADMAGAP